MDATGALLFVYIVSILVYIPGNVFLSRMQRLHTWRGALSGFWIVSPAAVPFLFSIILVATHLALRHSDLTGCTADDLGLNPDIGGIGVLVGLMLPCGVLFIVLL